MKNLILFLILTFIISCQDPVKLKNNNDNSIVQFLNSFENKTIDELKTIDFDTIQPGKIIDSIYVSNYLCDCVVNLCFYSNGPYQRSYFRLFKVKYTDNLLVIFYFISESNPGVRIEAATVNLTDEEVVSKLLLSKLDPSIEENIKTKIDQNFIFDIRRTFEIYNSDYLPDQDSIKVKEIFEKYKIDKNGKFKLIN